LFIKPNFAVEMFDAEVVEVFDFLGVVDVHFGHGCVEDCFTSQCEFCFLLNRKIAGISKVTYGWVWAEKSDTRRTGSFEESAKAERYRDNVVLWVSRIGAYIASGCAMDFWDSCAASCVRWA
jgi:hypothetical protein